MDVVVELLNTGSELMLGRVLNTHQQWLCRQLADMGLVVSRQVAVPDTGQAIQTSIRESLSRADLLITTGGLGPTSDDLTRELLAQLLARNLHEDPAVLAHIRSYFENRKRPMPERVRVQAMIPEGATVLANAYGTAPGLAMELRPNPFRPNGAPSWLILLPGPPRELRPMFTEAVVPLLKQAFPERDAFVCRTLRSTGIGESMVEQRIGPKLEKLVQAGMQLGYCACPGQVDVRLAANGEKAEELVRQGEDIVRAHLGQRIYTAEDEELEATLIHLLTKRKETLGLAESCTGGCIAHRLTNVPGASAVLLGGFVTYSNQAKQDLVGVDAQTLTEHGAVSEPVARQMAEGARRRLRADYAVAVTGIAGPSGGTPAKPVGTVFIALATPDETVVEEHLNAWDRETFKQVTAQQAMDLLRRKLLQVCSKI